ncbi:MAG: HAD hydrolase family protein [Planctomycetes bacterium]|nr:HAD hydrolase family protein [Planctomycetota bacterium]
MAPIELLPSLRGAAKSVKLVICDVDGVLTSGAIFLDQWGVESKGFSVVDGTGIHFLKRHGIQVGLLSGRKSAVVARRAEELNASFFYDGVIDKMPKLLEILESLNLPGSQACFIGDDLIDISCMRLCGFPVAVQNAHPEVKKAAAYVTRARGGEGAVREAAEVILRAQGRFGKIKERFYP